MFLYSEGQYIYNDVVIFNSWFEDSSGIKWVDVLYRKNERAHEFDSFPINGMTIDELGEMLDSEIDRVYLKMIFK